jgi:hypothetical protein
MGYLLHKYVVRRISQKLFRGGLLRHSYSPLLTPEGAGFRAEFVHVTLNKRFQN